MNKLAPLALLGSIAALATCSDDAQPMFDAPPPENPDVLWLALDGRETQVKLVGEEPRPY
jgi:hypothetical protein